MTYTNPDQIGEVTEITGIAKIIRADGSEEPIMLGSEIFIGDIVETDGAGAVNIGFVDDSSFAVSEDARISIDEFVFDPASESGDQDFSVVRGVFMYTSGLIGRENPDSVEIDTPVGSIGIRGTIIGGKIVEGGESQVSVLEGAIVVRNDAGEQLLTNQFDTVRLTSRDVAPSEPKTLDVARVANDYGGVKSVSSSLFSSFEDQMKQDQSPIDSENQSDDAEGKAQGDNQQEEENVEDKEASADEVVDETAEDAVEEEVKETLEAEPEDAVEEVVESRVEEVQKVKAERMEAREDRREKMAEMREKMEARQEAEDQDDFEPVIVSQPDSLVVVNESPTIHSALEDKFSVTGDIGGVIPFGVDGAVITKLCVNDPDGDVFSTANLSVAGNVFGQPGADFFEIVDDSIGGFVLKLKAGFAIYDDGGNYVISSDGGSSNVSGTSAIISDTFNIGVDLNDGAGNTSFENIIVSAGDVTHVTGTSVETLSSTDDIVFGDGDDNIMILGDSDFKFIKGGDGHDMIKLDGGIGLQTFDFRSTVSNASGNSADLKSIEEFRFVDQYDQLKLNIEDLKDLLKTSDSGEIKFAMGPGSDTLGGDDSRNGLYFNDGGTDVYLTDHGFTKEVGTVEDGGETFVKYSHVELGDVLIEANINGASTGGII